MITSDMCEAIPEDIDGSCDGCIAYTDIKLCADMRRGPMPCHKMHVIYKLKREYKTHYRTPPANYRDSENDLS